MPPNTSIFDDQPIQDRGLDLLWKQNGIIFSSIEDIAQQLCEPLISETNQSLGSNSLTFAVHGPWGSGKTSFIHMVLKEAANRAGSKAERLRVCYYQASSHARTALGAKASLAMHILETLAKITHPGESKRQAIRIFDRQVDQLDAAVDNLSDDQIVSRLEAIAQRMANLTNFAEVIEAELTGQGGVAPNEPHVMVVVIDDLDRCPSGFITAIIETIQRWSTVNNLFFVIAVDRPILQNAIASTITRRKIDADPNVALEKYVQYTVDIPAMGPSELEIYIKALLVDSQSEVFKYLGEHADLLARGIRVQTPRGLKRCINTIRPRLAQWLSSRADSTSNDQQDSDSPTISSASAAKEIVDPSQIRKQIKELILEYSWREFYQEQYKPTLKGWSNISVVLIALELICADYHQYGDREAFEFARERIQKRLLSASELPPFEKGLDGFLSTEPWFLLTKDKREGGLWALFAGIGPNQPNENGRSHTDSNAIFSAFDPLTEPPIRKLERFSREARQYREQGDLDNLLKCITGALTLLRENPNAFSPAEVADVGNLALYTEALATQLGQPKIQELALEMFNQSTRLNPRHINNRLNFVSFILDANLPAFNDEFLLEALELLGEDPTIYEAEDYVERWLSYRARLSYKLPGKLASWEVILDQALAYLKVKPTQRAFNSIVSFFSDVENADRSQLRQAARVYIPTTTGATQNHGLLIYADTLGRTNTRERLEVYKYITRPPDQGGIVDVPSRFYRGNALHNFAVDLDRNDYLQEAGRQWFDSYQIMGTHKMSGNLNQAYEIYLRVNCNRPDLATLVEDFRDMTEMVLAPDGLPTPDEFYPGGFAALELIV